MNSGGEALREPWESLRRQREAAGFGMWLFLNSEALLFGALIAAFFATRFYHPQAFEAAGKEAEIVYGTVNTLVLLTSSLTMAVASFATRAELRRVSFWSLGLTLALGLVFLGLKIMEWRSDLEKGMVPGPGFPMEQPGAVLFWGFYWALTPLHALHLIGGLSTVGFLTWQAARGARPLRSPAFEAAGLYWHLIDVVWIFLYPLIYLQGRASS
ncbi:cytochrome c oxidase subunit 3 [Roseomonas sp. E05]|uniref:cytochrome c oxidase subunit 3 n=1 Tax=Roseomonas sp. E05 TaxID=3046310 RepID=UPI0024B89471|nr:cytochrome c oxidase subunit 3 [Roseomonas sp. E05]MDJ0387562.1 cytochrome c oxidase subunit 3 [Roseomonas sp. E05]